MMELTIGTMVAVHNPGTIPEFIRAGEWVHIKSGKSHDINHWAVVHKFTADGAPVVIQAEPRGITDFRTIDEAVGAGGWYKPVELPIGMDIEKGLDFLRRQVGEKYGWFDIAACCANLYSPGFISIHKGNQWICSALVAEYARVCGWLHNWDNIYDVMPDDLWEATFSMWLGVLQEVGGAASTNKERVLWHPSRVDGSDYIGDRL
jgi:hypothetical protein